MKWYNQQRPRERVEQKLGRWFFHLKSLHQKVLVVLKHRADPKLRFQKIQLDLLVHRLHEQVEWWDQHQRHENEKRVNACDPNSVVNYDYRIDLSQYYQRRAVAPTNVHRHDRI